MGTHTWIRRSLRMLALAACLAASTSCALRPQPEPPAAASHLDPGKLLAQPSNPTAIVPESGFLRGAPGAADPPGAIVRAFNLDRPDDPAETIVRDDGSFDLELSMATGEEIRLQVHDGEARTVPVDVLIGDVDTVPSLSIRPLAACLILTPALESDLGVPPSGAFVDAGVQVSNQCDHAVDFGVPRLRRPASGLQLTALASWPPSLAPGESALVQVRYQGSSPLEEILLIEATAPLRDRRPITLRSGVAP